MTLSMKHLDVLKNLLDTQQTHFHDQKIDWDNIVNHFARRLEHFMDERPSIEIFRFLIQCSISDRVRSIGLNQWRTDITSTIESIPANTHDTPYWFARHDGDPGNTRQAHLDSIRSKLATYEHEFLMLKEGTTMLELSLWRAKMNGSTSTNLSSNEGRSKKKTKIDESEFRNQCRISCGADNVIENVLPYLLPAADKKDNRKVGNGAARGTLRR